MLVGWWCWAQAQQPSVPVPDPMEAAARIPELEAAVERLLDGPAGCWALEGKVSNVIRLTSPPRQFARIEQGNITIDASFRGRLDSGHWTELAYWIDAWTTDLVIDEVTDIVLVPLVGVLDPEIVQNLTPPAQPDLAKPAAEKPERADPGTTKRAKGEAGANGAQAGGLSIGIKPGASAEDAANNLQSTIDELGESSTSEVVVDPTTGGLRLESRHAVKGNPDPLLLVAEFPVGATLPVRVDLWFPNSLTVGNWPLTATVQRGQAHLVPKLVEDQAFPSVESLSLVAGVLGFTVGWEQRLTFTQARSCGSLASATP